MAADVQVVLLGNHDESPMDNPYDRSLICVSKQVLLENNGCVSGFF